ncbi:MAG TPA: hypothetical protein VFF65_12835 [Phycisphaerales bacterium]|nr:hypothetical protein [Phycisphaerales bacterium]
MPARTLNPNVPPDSTQFARIAGYFDDPIAGVRAFWGELNALDGISRRLTLVVVDRQGKRYAPELFKDKASGRHTGRWMISGYLSLTEFGAPVSPSFNGPAAVGMTLTETHPTPGSWFTVMTDARGVFAVDLGKALGTSVWVHAGVVGLLRSRPAIAWSTAEAEEVDLS